jgi:hypothetical protein
VYALLYTTSHSRGRSEPQTTVNDLINNGVLNFREHWSANFGYGVTDKILLDHAQLVRIQTH